MNKKPWRCVALLLVIQGLIPATLIYGLPAAGSPARSADRPDRSTPFCSSPTYNHHASQLFSEIEFDDVIEVSFRIDDQLRKRIQTKLDSDFLTYDLLGKHVMYFPATKSKMPLGMMHFRKMAGSKFGLITVGWRMDLKFKLVDFIVEGRDPATFKIMEMRDELKQRFRGMSSDLLESWLDDGTTHLSTVGQKELQVENQDEGVHDVLGIMVWLARLTMTSAKLKFSEQENAVPAMESNESPMMEYMLQFVAIPEPLIEQVEDLQRVTKSELRAACNAVKKVKDPSVSEIDCKVISATRILMSGSREPYYSVDSEMKTNGSLTIRWIVNSQIELIGVHILGASEELSEETKKRERAALEKEIGARWIPEAECSSGTRILVNRALLLCKMLKKVDQ
ncbi:MAG: hypothetical protein OSB09_08620 [Planctomycetota bacterium]|nr:hypothetical protein [Planctomycetota bacterium]